MTGLKKKVKIKQINYYLYSTVKNLNNQHLYHYGRTT